MVSYYNSLGSMFPASSPAAAAAAHRSQGVSSNSPGGYFNPYGAYPPGPPGEALSGPHSGGPFPSPEVPGGTYGAGSSSSVSQQFPASMSHHHHHAAAAAAAAEMYGGGGFQGFEGAPNWHAGAWPSFSGENGIPRYEPWSESTGVKEGDYEEEPLHHNQHHQFASHHHQLQGGTSLLPSPPPSTAGQATSSLQTNSSSSSSESPAAFGHGSGASGLYSGHFSAAQIRSSSSSNGSPTPGPTGPAAGNTPLEEEGGESSSPNYAREDESGVSLPASSLSPPPLIPRPQPARSPFQWMKKPAYAPSGSGVTSEKSGKGRTRTKDKYRVVYSDHQRLELEKEFHYSRYITIRRKAELANNVGLSERQVKIWFQNRRAKERRALKKSDDPKDSKMDSDLVPGGPLAFPEGSSPTEGGLLVGNNNLHPTHLHHHHQQQHFAGHNPSSHFTSLKYE